MTTEIMKSFSSLQDELEKAKDNLKAMDEHIKKLTGRDPGDMQTRLGVKRPANAPEEFRGRGRGFPLMRGGPGARPEDEEAPAAKKRPGDTRTVFSRLSGPTAPKRNADSDVEDELPNKPAISSRVIATPKEPPSRQEAMAAQSSDQRSHERNRRMFGALLGTLQKFRQEETRMKEKEEKRAKVERKLEENAKREKEELKRERQELFLERKRKQAEIRKIELKMLRIKEQDEWEAKHRHLLNFIQTRAKPHIFYLPKIHTVKTEERLVASQKVVAKMIEKKRVEVRQELEAIERRGRWRQGLGDVEPGQHSGDEQPMDILDKENRLGLIEGPPASDTSAMNQSGAGAAAAVSAASASAAASAGGGGNTAPSSSSVVVVAASAGGEEEEEEETAATAAATAAHAPGDEATVAAAAAAAVEGAVVSSKAAAEEAPSRRRRRRRGAHDDDDDDDEDEDDEDESEEDEERRRRLQLRNSPVPAPAAAPALPQRPRRPPRGARRASARSEDEDDEDDADAASNATPPDADAPTAAATLSGGDASTPPAPAPTPPLPPSPPLDDDDEEEGGEGRGRGKGRRGSLDHEEQEGEEEEVVAQEVKEGEKEEDEEGEGEKDEEGESSRDVVMEMGELDEEDAASPTLPPVPGEDSPPLG